MNEENKKTCRFGFACITICILGLFVLIFKTNRCMPHCVEEFHSLEFNSSEQKCSIYASMELVTEPKKGILCKCNKNITNIEK